MPERSMPGVPDLNGTYRAERAMRDLTWGPGRMMPEVPQMTHPSVQGHVPGQRTPRMGSAAPEHALPAGTSSGATG